MRTTPLRFFALISICSFCFACDKKTPSDAVDRGAGARNDAAQKTGAKETSAEAPIAKADTSPATIYAALGCPGNAITDTGCKTCPTGQEIWAEGVAEDVAISITSGKFSSDDAPQVLAVFGGCQDRAGGDEVTNYVHLVDEEGAWKIKSVASLIGLESCEALEGPEGMTRHLCLTETGRHGHYPTTYEAIIWEKARGQEPIRQILVNAVNAHSCANNYDIIHAVSKTLDGDNINFEITSTHGPYMGKLEECSDGDSFTSPLSPRRESVKYTTKLSYAVSAQGYKEAQGKKALIMPSRDFVY
ncbi:MAG: hypothetical protein AAGN82_04145 [Myxococcota bacterium]